VFEIASAVEVSVSRPVGGHDPDRTRSDLALNEFAVPGGRRLEQGAANEVPFQKMMQENAPSLGSVCGEWST
jgi:hypothetical protein